MAYMDEPWFHVLTDACKASSQRKVAERLDVSNGAISQVINGTGLYGTGKASTEQIAQRVLHRLESWSCPYLSERSTDGQAVVINGEQCRDYAHRSAPSLNPQAMQHWQACHRCEHRKWTAPSKTDAEPASTRKKERKS
jgi:transcriptional regulator with XRE-family HTH domain